MPQLDSFAYGSQVFWLIGTFLTLYFVLLRTGLPKLYRVLRFRKAKLAELRKGVVDFEREIYFVDKGVRSAILNFVKPVKGLSERLGKVIDRGLEVEEAEVRERLRLEGQAQELGIESSSIENRLALGLKLDKNEFIKDKNSIRKRIINN